jgi:predicted ribosomally synthesized peptide with nif11-like leader
MINSNAKAFIAALQKDARLRNQFVAISMSADPHELLALAAYHGYKLTFEELNEASVDVMNELSDGELSGVSGGLKAPPLRGWE